MIVHARTSARRRTAALTAVSAAVLAASAVLAAPASADSGPGSGYGGDYGNAWTGGKWGKDYYTYNPGYQYRSADVKVTATGPARVTHGQEHVYTVEVTNTGSAAASRVGMTTTLPNGFTYLAARTSQGDVRATGDGRVLADLGAIKPKETVRVQIAGKAPSHGGGTVELATTAWTASPETHMSDNRASVATRIG
ncbi:MAG TPA: hypothetical protein VFH94_04045 [Streptomyces sp.]|nr:hypothetical protein [Streptomyces sp.]